MSASTGAPSSRIESVLCPGRGGWPLLRAARLGELQAAALAVVEASGRDGDWGAVTEVYPYPELGAEVRP